jgi:hypothetical protein
MSDPKRTARPARRLVTATSGVLALVAFAAAPPAAQARIWLSAGVPFPGYYYGPGPYYGYYPPPSYYPPPPGSYPPADAYAPGAAAPSAYSPPEYPPSAAIVPPSGSGNAVSSPKVTYTNKPAFTNSTGQTCREYKTTDTAAGHDVFGTACKEADGQWRVAN